MIMSVEQKMEQERKRLNMAFFLNLILSLSLFATTLFLLKTPIIGFNAFCTAGVQVIYSLLSMLILNRSPSAFSVGLVMGASLLVVFLSFQGMILWGLVSDMKQNFAGTIASCINAALFSLQIWTSFRLWKSKEDVIDTYAAYEYIPDSSDPSSRVSDAEFAQDSTMSYQTSALTSIVNQGNITQSSFPPTADI
uniref:Uncharacterized protein AlNc14C8G1111 n=1 Tax=Albugo laibachii Nc14 TaxID=890382 RepID=F0W238_9STRA|nr:conserved hypothetical protein [Albugo laibachii Nc14]|eukprot:CCA15117.1 conserved hypothetical protein [Albugo laibachii Nc14]